jgi:uncharacterized protein YidB (DUF937 family)
MGFFGNLATKEFGNMGGGKGALVLAIVQMIQNRQGGIQGLMQAFQQNGMGGAVQSWIGTGQNQQVSPEQVTHALGQDQVQQVADQAGISHQDASSGIASLLPQIVDKLTPDGQIPHHNDLMGKGMEMLKRHFGL